MFEVKGDGVKPATRNSQPVTVLGQVARHVHRRPFLQVRSFVSVHRYARVAIIVVFPVLPAVIDLEVFFFVHEFQNIGLAEFEIRSQLNGQSRTRLLAEPSVDAAREIYPEPSRVAPSVLSFG